VSSERRRSWPFAVVLILFITLLGALPHLRFSLLVGEATHFFSAYDEDFYGLLALGGGGRARPHRWVSSHALVGLSKVSGGSWEMAMMAADIVFPALCALLAWMLIGRITRRRLLRLTLSLGLLFAQELMSLGCWTIWRIEAGGPGPGYPDSPIYDLRWLLSSAPAWLRLVWPDYASSFLALYRTPEPQVSHGLLLGTLLLLLEISRPAPQLRRLKVLVALAAVVNVALAAVYFFSAAAIVVFESVLSTALMLCRRSRPALIVGTLAVVGGLSLVVGVVAYQAPSDSRTYGFASHIPVLTPSTMGAAIGLVVLLTALRWSRRWDPAYPFVVACFCTVLVLTNQQVITGWMVSARDWERWVDYTLLFVGGATTAAWLFREARVRLHVVYAFAGAALVTTSFVLLRTQDRVFEQEFLVANLEGVALQRAVEAVEAGGLRDATWMLEDPKLGAQLELRLERRIPLVLDAGAVFRSPMSSVGDPEGTWGSRSPFKRELFEHFARTPRTVRGVARVLRREADAGAGFFLGFLFDLRDFWLPITDGRRTRLDEVRAHLPGIVREYDAYLRDGDPCWARPVVVLTRESVAERASTRWQETFLVEMTVGEDPPLMNMHAYRQVIADPVGLPSAAGSPDCD
jgi:hypothetical protein